MAGDSADTEEFDVVVVGAGVSGLCAAYRIFQKDQSLRIAVLEAKDRIGGRTFGAELTGANGQDVWDLGGQWVSTTQPHVMALLRELSLDTYEQFTEGKKVLQLRDNTVKTYSGDIPSLPPHALVDLHMFMREAENMIRQGSAEDPGTFRNADLWDCTTLESLKLRRLWTQAARETLDASLRCIFGVEPSQISVLYYLAYTAAAGGLEPIISARKNVGGQEMKVKGGAWQICHKLLASIGSDKVRLNEPVTSIEQTDEGVVVSTTTQSYQCERVIVALPPHLQARINFSPSLPSEKLHVIHRMPPGNITKIIVTYRTYFWREAGLSGEAVASGGKPVVNGVSSGPLCIVYDATSSNENPAIVAFIGGDQHLEYSKLSAADRQRAVLHSLSEFFGPKALDFLDYVEKDWSREAYNNGGPVSVGTPGMMTMIDAGLRQPEGRLHFAGTESATVWCGFINGAVQAGYRAANEVLYNLRPQVIGASDLEGTAYDKTRAAGRRRTSSHSRVLRWTCGLILLGGAIYWAHKRRPSITFW